MSDAIRLHRRLWVRFWNNLMADPVAEPHEHGRVLIPDFDEILLNGDRVVTPDGHELARRVMSSRLGIAWTPGSAVLCIPSMSGSPLLACSEYRSVSFVVDYDVEVVRDRT